MTSSDARADFTVSGNVARALARFIAARADAATEPQLLASVGLASEDLAHPDARVTQRAYNELWELGARTTGDDALGLHFAEMLDLDALDVAGHVAVRSATFGEAMARVAELSRLAHDAGRVEIERASRGGARRGEVVVHPGCRGLRHAVPRQVAEFSAASVVVLGRHATRTPLVPRAVAFRHARPPSIAEHLRVFGVEPTFGARETVVVLDEAALALPIVGPRDGTLAYLDAYARQALARLPTGEESIVEAVRRHVASSLGHDLSAARIAKKLGLHPRTLQRRLEAEGTSLALVVDETRRALAEQYLADDRLAIAEVAYLLGYSDRAVFHRAFRRWTGATPTAFRAAHTA